MSELINKLLEMSKGKATNLDALTSGELAAKVKRSPRWVREHLKKAIDNGLMECVKKTIIDITGREFTVPAYQMIKGKK